MVLLESDPKTLKKGALAPDFCLKNVDGKLVSLKDFKDKPVVVIFMCNHCPYVKPKMEEIAKLQDDFETKGVVVLCVNSNDPTDFPEDDFENMKILAEDFGYKYYLVDETQEVAKSYGATCTPDPFVFNSAHRLIYHGRINDAMQPDDKPKRHDLREVLNKLTSHAEIEEWFVPSIGCSIKWK